MKKYIISIILLFITAQMTQAQLVVSTDKGKTVADFRKALHYQGYNTRDNKNMNIVTFESRIQTINGTSRIYSSECIALYNISYAKDKIKIKRKVIDCKAHKYGKNNSIIKNASPDLTQKPINMILAEGTRTINRQNAPVTLTKQAGTTELEINKTKGMDTLSTKVLGIVTKLDSNTEKLTYSSQDNNMYIDKLLKINAEIRMKTEGGNKGKEYTSTDNVCENIYIIHTDYKNCSFKEYMKNLKTDFASLHESIKGQKDMPDNIKKEIENILNENR